MIISDHCWVLPDNLKFRKIFFDDGKFENQKFKTWITSNNFFKQKDEIPQDFYEFLVNLLKLDVFKNINKSQHRVMVDLVSCLFGRMQSNLFCVSFSWFKFLAIGEI